MAPRLALLAVALVAVPPASAAAQTTPQAPSSDAEQRLGKRLARYMRGAGPLSGAYVVNVDTRRAVFRRRHTRARVLASNTKLFTTAAALARFGVEGRLATELLGRGFLDPEGTWRGDLFLRGGGDPTFGSRSLRRLAVLVKDAGIRRISGRIHADESRFDRRRGGRFLAPQSYLSPLSALAYAHGLSARYAAGRLAAALRRRGVRVSRRVRSGRTPEGTTLLATVESPTMARLAAMTNKPSDNFFAEMLLKAIAWRATGKGTTRRGARLAAGFARRLGARARLVDGSGLSRRNRTSPHRVVRLLLAIRQRDEFSAFNRSLALAGRDGTLARRMRRGAARRRCRGKTGTLSGVSTLSGYCRARSGDTYAFSILMNRVSTSGARRIQDRMAHAIAGVSD